MQKMSAAIDVPVYNVRDDQKKYGGISMIQLTYEQKNSIGLQYILDRLNPSSPYGQERVRRMTPYTVKKKIF